MGNYRFRVSDMMPSFWFYKLKEVSQPNKRNFPKSAAPMPQPRRGSCYISTRERTEPLPHSPVNHKAVDTHFPVGSPGKTKLENSEAMEELSELKLPPILTKPIKRPETTRGYQIEEAQPSSPTLGARRPKVALQKSKALRESLVVVMASADPRRDFRDSMVEMIRENNIREAKDLEELLVCYLSLNSRRYHRIILREFKQIWLELTSP